MFKNLPFTAKVFMVPLYDQCFECFHSKIELFDIKEFRYEKSKGLAQKPEGTTKSYSKKSKKRKVEAKDDSAADVK